LLTQPQPFLDRKGKMTIKYGYDANNIGTGGFTLKFSFNIMKGDNVVGEDNGYNSKGENFTLITEASSNSSSAKSTYEENLKTLELNFNEAEKAGDAGRMRKCCDNLNSIYRENQKGVEIYDRLSVKCKAFQLEATSWQQAEKCDKAGSRILQKIDCYKAFLAQYSKGKYALAANDRIRELAEKPLGNAPKPAAQEIEKTPIKLPKATELTKITENEAPKDSLAIPTQAASIDSFKVHCHLETDESLCITIQGGTPPFELRLYQGEMVSCLISLGAQRNLKIPKTMIESKVSAGKYNLHIFDRIGQQFPDAACLKDYQVGVRKNAFPIRWMGILAGIVLVFLAGYFFRDMRRY